METVTPCSAALFLTSYLWAGISIRYGPVLLSHGDLSLNFDTSPFANSISVVGTDLLKEPLGSGSSLAHSSDAGSSFTCTCLKYCKIDITTLTGDIIIDV